MGEKLTNNNIPVFLHSDFKDLPGMKEKLKFDVIKMLLRVFQMGEVCSVNVKFEITFRETKGS